MPFAITGQVGTIRIGQSDYVELQSTFGHNSLYHAVGFLAPRSGFTDVAALREAVAGDLPFFLRIYDRETRTWLLRSLGRLKDNDDPMADKWEDDIRRYMEFTVKGSTPCDMLAASVLAHVLVNDIIVYDAAGAPVDMPGNGLVVSTDEGSIIRLVARPIRTGHNGLQFNPLVLQSAFNAERDLPALAEPAQPACQYWFGAPQMRPYVTPVCFSDYQHGLTAAPSGFGHMVSMAFSSSASLDSATPKITELLLTNYLNDEPLGVSESFRRADVTAADPAVRRGFTLPLARGPAPTRYAPHPDVAHTRLSIAIEHANRAATVRFRIVKYRAASAPAAIAYERSVTRDVLGAAKGVVGDQTLYEVPLSTILPAASARSLYWTEGPYLLLAAVGGDSRADRAAFTTFDVPSPFDVSTIENVGATRGVFLGDNMAALAAAATIEARNKDTVRRFSPSGGALTDHFKFDEAKLRSTNGSAAVSEIGRVLMGHGKAYDPNTVNVLYQREDDSYFAVTSWASVIVCRKVDRVWYAHSVYVTGGNRWFGILDKPAPSSSSPSSSAAPSSSAPSSSAPPAASVRGFTQIKPNETWKVRNEVGTGEEVESEWQCYYLHLRNRRYPLCFAHTAGISSCAGGVTFDTGGDWLILWHVDAPPASPVQRIIQMIWPTASDCPGLRTIGLVHPNPWELNKYRSANLCPAEIHARSKSVFLIRGAHLYNDKVASNCGADVFGLEFGDTPSLVGTYDISQRAIRMRSGSTTPAQRSATRVDLAADVFGTFRTGSAVVNSNDTLATYFTALANPTKELKTEILNQSRCFTIANLVGGAFDAVDALCNAVGNEEKLFVGERGELEITHQISDRWDQRQRSASELAPVGSWFGSAASELLAMEALQREVEADILARTALERDYNLVGVTGDGNCMFRAFGVAYENLAADTANHATYRTEATTHMTASPATFSYERLGIHGSGFDSTDAYIASMAIPASTDMTREERQRHWGGGPELSALCRRYRVRIHVHPLRGHATVFEELLDVRYTPTRDIHLYFQGGNHYEAMFRRPAVVVPVVAPSSNAS